MAKHVTKLEQLASNTHADEFLQAAFEKIFDHAAFCNQMMHSHSKSLGKRYQYIKLIFKATVAPKKVLSVLLQKDGMLWAYMTGAVDPIRNTFLGPVFGVYFMIASVNGGK